MTKGSTREAYVSEVPLDRLVLASFFFLLMFLAGVVPYNPVCWAPALFIVLYNHHVHVLSVLVNRNLQLVEKVFEN